MQIVAPKTLVAVEKGGKQRIIVLGNDHVAFMCRRLRVWWPAGLVSLPD